MSKIKMLVMDVDGTLTDGHIYTGPSGEVMKVFSCKDGYALAYAIRHGYRVCIITGGYGAILERRLRMLGVKEYYIDCMDKITTLREYMKKYDLKPENVLYMGDDIPDLECMELVGIPVCPADACSEVIEASRYVSEFGGGKGAVRDIVEQVLRSQDEWAKDREGVLGAASR